MLFSSLEKQVIKKIGITVLHDSMGGNRWDWFSGGKRVGELYGYIYTWLIWWESVGFVLWWKKVK